jgi:hypothetical protein
VIESSGGLLALEALRRPASRLVSRAHLPAAPVESHAHAVLDPSTSISDAHGRTDGRICHVATIRPSMKTKRDMRRESKRCGLQGLCSMRMRGLEPPPSCLDTDLNRSAPENMGPTGSGTSHFAGFRGRVGSVWWDDCCQTVARKRQSRTLLSGLVPERRMLCGPTSGQTSDAGWSGSLGWPRLFAAWRRPVSRPLPVGDLTLVRVRRLLPCARCGADVRRCGRAALAVAIRNVRALRLRSSICSALARVRHCGN